MTSPVKSSGFAALKLIGILAVFALSGERVDVQFLSHDHPLEPGEIKLGDVERGDGPVRIPVQQI
jgi:hypothetical protein